MKSKFSKDALLNSLETERIQLQDSSNKFLKYFFLVPAMAAIAGFLIFKNPPGGLIPAAITLVFTILMYYINIGHPFSKVKASFKKAMLDEYMSAYHPSIDYEYHSNKKEVRKIVKDSKLVSCNSYHEEDVIKGIFEDISFYLSEIHLKRKSDKSSVTVFKGILFKIKIKGKSFPTSRIQSKLGLIKRMFNDFKKNEEFGFSYETTDYQRFNKELKPLFPFIRHLISQQEDVRIATQGDEITIMMKSDIPFMDDPKPSLGKTLINDEYYTNMMRQLNSFLFIIESFSLGLDHLELEEQLELKLKETIEIKRH